MEKVFIETSKQGLGVPNVQRLSSKAEVLRHNIIVLTLRRCDREEPIEDTTVRHLSEVNRFLKCLVPLLILRGQQETLDFVVDMFEHPSDLIWCWVHRQRGL